MEWCISINRMNKKDYRNITEKRIVQEQVTENFCTKLEKQKNIKCIDLKGDLFNHICMCLVIVTK